MTLTHGSSWNTGGTLKASVVKRIRKAEAIAKPTANDEAWGIQHCHALAELANYIKSLGPYDQRVGALYEGASRLGDSEAWTVPSGGKAEQFLAAIGYGGEQQETADALAELVRLYTSDVLDTLGKEVQAGLAARLRVPELENAR